MRALDPWRDDSTLDAELAVALERVSSFLVQKLAVRYPQEHRATLRQSVYYKTAYAVSQGEVEVSKLVAEFGCHRKTVSRYLRGFVDEGWVRRVRRGVYALKIYTT